MFKPIAGVMKCEDCNTSSSEGVIKDRKKKRKEINVVEEHESHPIVEKLCDKCNNKKAYFWMLQTRSSDEPETQFFKCTECKHTWREY